MRSAAAPALAPTVDPEIEAKIGEMTAAAACALAGALGEYWNGGLTLKSKLAGGDAVAELWKLRQSTLGELNFDATARALGTKILKERMNGGCYPADAATVLVDETLAILNRVTAAMAN